jgi:drug/metabolite transporter (DMT)-like permease
LNFSATDHSRQGILLIVFGLAIAAFTGAVMKLLAGSMGALQITWLRFLGYALMMLPLVAWRFGRSAFRPARPGMQLVRGLTMAGSTSAFITGARTVDYADAIAILYAYPFLLTVMAVFFLGERVRLVGWLGVAGGFAGVLLIMRPDFSGFNSGTLFVFLCAFIVSIQMTLNRKLGALSHPLVTSFWGALGATLVLSPLLPVVWQPVDSRQVFLLLVMVICGGVSQTLIVFAFARTEASTLAPFTYFEIVAAVAFGFLFFGTMPGMVSWVGIALIFGCGLMVARSLSQSTAPRRQPKV